MKMRYNSGCSERFVFEKLLAGHISNCFDKSVENRRNNIVREAMDIANTNKKLNKPQCVNQA